MSGSGGKFLKIYLLLWLRMPLPTEFEYFLETKTLLPTLEKQFFANPNLTLLTPVAYPSGGMGGPDKSWTFQKLVLEIHMKM